jgi:hypothetical protein
MDKTAEVPRDPEAIVNAFLQHKSMKQMQDYLARGRRLAKLDVERLNKDWIIAVTNDGWSALRLRGLEPPYGAEQQSADRSARMKETERKKVREVVREIGGFHARERQAAPVEWNKAQAQANAARLSQR